MEDIKKMAELTWPEFELAMKETDIALIPVGTLEEHGHHLPLGTDAFGGETIAERIAQKVKCIILPPVYYGNNVECWNTSQWPGSINISTETLSALYREIGTEIVRFGARRIMFVSGHFNIVGPLTQAAFRIWQQTGAAVGIHEYFLMCSDITSKYTDCIHADQVETSMIMIGNSGNLIKLDRAIPNPYPFPPPKNDAEKEIWRRFLMGKYTCNLDKDYLYAGNLGDPRKASPEIGEAVMAAAVDRGLEMLEVLNRHVNDVKIAKYRESFT